ncbi:MAG: hypothetical protein ACKOFP_10055 [Actinomycetota bacterium]
MRLHVAFVAPLVVLVAACGSGSDSSTETMSPSVSTPSSAEPSPTPEETASESPSPTAVAPDTLFVDVIDEALAPYEALIGSPAAGADLGSVLPLHDGDVPLPDGATIAGAGTSVREWDDETFYAEQMIGLGEALTKADLEAFGAAAPSGWTYNSLSTTDSSSSLVMTRDADGLRIVMVARPKPEPGEPPAEFGLEQQTPSLPEPAWLASLPTPEGGTLVAVGEGIGEVDINFTPAAGGLVTATWRYPVEQLDALLDYIASGALESAGFTLVDPDSISFGASYIDVTAGEWTGQVIVGETIFEDSSAAELTWYLTRR